jgi:hypothetical protein
MSRPSTLAAGCRCLLRRKLVSRSFLVGGLTAFTARSSRFVRSKLVSRPFLVRRLASFTGDLSLFLFFHGAETTVAFACHAPVLSKREGVIGCQDKPKLINSRSLN